LPTPAPAASAEPELTPFSLEELGLTPEEIAALGLSEAGVPETPPEPSPTASAEPEMTPFSLEELGLTPEEIAGLNLEVAETPEPAFDDSFDFGMAEVAPVEKVTKRTEPRVEEPPPPADPADVAFQPEALESLDDIWHVTAPPPPMPEPALPAAREEPAKPAEQPMPAARPAPAEERTTTRLSTGGGSARTPAPPPAPRGEPGTRTSTRTSLRGAEADRFARREALMTRPATVARAAAATKGFADFVPSGDEVLDEYLLQLADEPGNVGLAMAIGRLSAQTGRHELMALAYKSVLRTGLGVEELVEELESLVDLVDSGDVRRQLYRLLGDTYSKQGRLRDAMAAYNSSFGR
jgi:hypothetical protein